MFDKLKEKLKSWTKKVSEIEDVNELEEEKIIENPKKEISITEKFNEALQNFESDIKKNKEVEQKSEQPKIKFLDKFKHPKISEEDLEKYLNELEILLLENNVALEIVDKIIKNLKQKIIEEEVSKKEIEKKINEYLKNILNDILIEPFDFSEEIKENKPYVVLFCGINGTGKTTTIAKVANMLKEKKISCVMAAADTFRAASIEQIKKHGENLNIKVISSNYGSDPASVGYDAIQYSKKNKIDCVLIDTAGRMHTDKNLLREIEKISRVCNPNLKIFVGESITGNDAIEQAKAFNDAIEINGIILSKADIDEKGGTALSIGQAINKPVLYLGTGQNYEDLEFFDKKKFIEKMGL